MAGRSFFLQKSWPRVGTGDSSPAYTVSMPLVEPNGHVDIPVWFNDCKSRSTTPKHVRKGQTVGYFASKDSTKRSETAVVLDTRS